MTAVENHKEMAPFGHYVARYEALDPVEAAARCGVAYDGARGVFAMRLLCARYELSWPRYGIRCDDEDGFALGSVPAQILMLRYLLEGRRSEGTGKFLTYREMPWGEVYLKPFTGRCLTRAAFAFGNRLEAFKRAMSELPATPIDRGDAGFQLEVMPGYDVRLIMWEGDDEFPPGSQLLYSDNFPMSFSAEDRTVVGDIVISDIKRRMK